MVLYKCHVFLFVEVVKSAKALLKLLIMQFNYEKLDITPKIHCLVKDVYIIANEFPTDEKFGLSSQIKRSVTSVLLNLAEGSAKQSSPEFARFITMSVGSLVEVDATLKLAVTLKFINESRRASIDPLLQELYFKLIALKKSQRL